MTPYSAPWQRATSSGGQHAGLWFPDQWRVATCTLAAAIPVKKSRSASVTNLNDDTPSPLTSENLRFGGDSNHQSLDPAIARSRVEALLLIAKSPLNYRKIATLTGLEDATQARTLVAELNDLYDSQGRSFRIEQLAGGSRMMTRSVVAPWLRRLGVLAPAIRLSWPMMETLAVVAYRQDVTRADVESVRGVACGEILRQLMQLDLVRISGRSEDLGRPYLYGTTKRFLKICGLPSINALPAIDSRGFCDDVSGSPDPANDCEVSDMSPSHESVASTDSQDPKESDVSLVLTDALATGSVLSHFTTGVADAAVEATNNMETLAGDAPVAVIEDEEDDLFESGLEDDDDFVDDDDDDDWDDDDEEDDDDEVDDVEDEVEDEVDAEEEEADEEDSWEEVDDDDADEDWDDEEEEDDDDDWDDDDEEEDDDDDM